MIVLVILNTCTNTANTNHNDTLKWRGMWCQLKHFNESLTSPKKLFREQTDISIGDVDVCLDVIAMSVTHFGTRLNNPVSLERRLCHLTNWWVDFLVKLELEGIKNLSPPLYHCQSTIQRRRKWCRDDCRPHVITNSSNWRDTDRSNVTIALSCWRGLVRLFHPHGNKSPFVLLLNTSYNEENTAMITTLS